MKTVGIITCHYFDNYGSVLQAYALREYINRLPDRKAELIHYIPEGVVYHPYEPGPTGKIAFERKRYLFEQFLAEKCGVAGVPLQNVTGNNYDYYCVGSDQLWNFRICDSRQEYFLSHLDTDAVKISYATSLGQAIGKLENDQALFQTRLKSFKAVSVREAEHAYFLQKACGIPCSCVVDPTFLLAPKDYETLVQKTKLRENPFILFIWYMHDERMQEGVEFVNTLSRKYSLPIVHSLINPPSYLFAKNGGSMMYGGIEDFLWYIQNAQAIVTNSYHATLFSIYFRRPFYTFLVKSMQSRFNTLCQQMPIASRLVTKYIPADQLTLDINYDEIYVAVEPHLQKSKKFLANALDVEGI